MNVRTPHLVSLLLWLGATLLGPSLAAAEPPVREQISEKSWTITFMPADRAVAEGVARRLDEFEKRTVEISTKKQELGYAEITARAGELAKRVSEICALNGHAADFQREFARVALELKSLVAAADAAFFLRKLELWRATDVSARLAAGEKIPGFVWNEQAGRPEIRFSFNWQTDADYRATVTSEMPPGVMVRIDENIAPADAVAAAAKSFGEWSDLMGQSYANLLPIATRVSMAAAIRSVIASECAGEAASRWVSEGLTLWAWRELVVQSVSPQAASRYAWPVLQLPVPRAGGHRLNLEAWPDKDVDEYAPHAAQVFVNIGEMDGANELAALLDLFWRLPKEQRTSASLRRLYQERTGRPLELRAPWRSLGMPVAGTIQHP